MRAHSPIRTFVAVISITSLLAGQANAAPAEDDTGPSEGESHTDAAIAAFEAGRYDEAVEHFQRAYEVDQNPNNLFNIGRVYEEAGDLDAAVDYYKRFISKPGVSLDNRKYALERIEVLEQIIEKTKPVAEPEPQPEPKPAAEPAQPQTRVDDGQDAGDERRRKQRVAGYVLLGLGGASLIAGGAVGGLASGVEKDLSTTTDPTQRVDLVDKGDGMALTADALFITGGTLALVGLIVTLTALPKRKTSQTAFAPSFNGQGGGVVVLHRF